MKNEEAAQIHDMGENVSKVTSGYSGTNSKSEKIKNPTFSGDLRTFSKLLIAYFSNFDKLG